MPHRWTLPGGAGGFPLLGALRRVWRPHQECTCSSSPTSRMCNLGSQSIASLPSQVEPSFLLLWVLQVNTAVSSNGLTSSGQGRLRGKRKNWSMQEEMKQNKNRKTTWPRAMSTVGTPRPCEPVTSSQGLADTQGTHPDRVQCPVSREQFQGRFPGLVKTRTLGIRSQGAGTAQHAKSSLTHDTLCDTTQDTLWGGSPLPSGMKQLQDVGNKSIPTSTSPQTRC